MESFTRYKEPRLKLRSKSGLYFQDKPFDLLQRLDHCKTFRRTFIFFKEIFSSFYCELPAPEKIMYQQQVFYIYRTKMTISFTVFPWLNDVKLSLPESQE